MSASAIDALVERPPRRAVPWWPAAVRVATIVGDVSIVGAGSLLAAAVAPVSAPPGGGLSVLVVFLVATALERVGAWRVEALRRWLDHVLRVNAAGALAFTAVIAASQAGLVTMPVTALVVWWGGSVGGLLVWRRLLGRLVERLRRSGHLVRHFVIVGASEPAARLVEAVRDVEPGMRLIGLFDDRASRVPAYIGGFPVLGGIDELLRLAGRHPIDLVVVALPWDAEARLLACLKRLRRLPADVRLCPEAIGFRLRHRPVGHLAGVPLLSVVDRPLGGGGRLIKALADRTLSAVALAFLAPLLATVAVALGTAGTHPVLCRQRRLGFDQMPIEVLRFRTGPAVGTDPLGRLLRRAGVDGLPQLWNVLRGELSLVGPTPHPIPHDRRCVLLVDENLSRHRVKPGVTGWAQIHGAGGGRGSLAEIERRLRYDLFYIENWSLLLDLRILACTFLVGLGAGGAER